MKIKINIKSLVRFFFLFLIFILWIFNKIKIWLVLLLIGLLITPFWGRLYCGWVCPIFTTRDIFAPLMKKPMLSKYNYVLENKFLKAIIFIIFILIFFVINKFNLGIPFFILLIPLGLFVTALFGSTKWHRICPFGTIFSLPARFASKGYEVISEDCSKCGLCVKNCVNDCLVFKKDGSIVNDKKDCLACGKCREICPQKNISFQGLENKSKRAK